MKEKTIIIEEIQKLMPVASFSALEFVYYYLLGEKKDK